MCGRQEARGKGMMRHRKSKRGRCPGTSRGQDRSLLKWPEVSVSGGGCCSSSRMHRRTTVKVGAGISSLAAFPPSACVGRAIDIPASDSSSGQEFKIKHHSHAFG